MRCPVLAYVVLYAMPGTDLAHRDGYSPFGVVVFVAFIIITVSAYAPGTEMASILAYHTTLSARACYAMPGADLRAYAMCICLRTCYRCPVLMNRVKLPANYYAQTLPRRHRKQTSGTPLRIFWYQSFVLPESLVLISQALPTHPQELQQPVLPTPYSHPPRLVLIYPSPTGPTRGIAPQGYPRQVFQMDAPQYHPPFPKLTTHVPDIGCALQVVRARTHAQAQALPWYKSQPAFAHGTHFRY
eukprot:454588-Rhodomonas_salina.2